MLDLAILVSHKFLIFQYYHLNDSWLAVKTKFQSCFLLHNDFRISLSVHAGQRDGLRGADHRMNGLAAALNSINSPSINWLIYWNNKISDYRNVSPPDIGTRCGRQTYTVYYLFKYLKYDRCSPVGVRNQCRKLHNVEWRQGSTVIVHIPSYNMPVVW